MKRGFHWIGELPDGRYALLYADPILKKTHTEIATFAARIDAIRYCRTNRILLATAENSRGPLRIRNEELPRNQQRLYDALQQRADKDGFIRVTARELMLDTDIKDRSMLRAVMNTLYTKGLAERVEAGWGDEPTTYRIKQKKPPSEEGGKSNSRTV